MKPVTVLTVAGKPREFVLTELLHSGCLRRLMEVSQRGYLSAMEHPPTSRGAHCIGAMEMVRNAGGSLLEQVMALMHDFPHVTTCHVIDYLPFGQPVGTSVHEVRGREIMALTDVDAILKEHVGKTFEEMDDLADHGFFPMLEQPGHALCADRGDYTLRDAVAQGITSQADADECRRGVIGIALEEEVERDGTMKKKMTRRLCMKDLRTARLMGEFSIRVYEEVCLSPYGAGMLYLTAQILRPLVEEGVITIESLVVGAHNSDARLWTAVEEYYRGKDRVGEYELYERARTMRGVRFELLPIGSTPPMNSTVLKESVKLKAGYIDPLVLHEGSAVVLSELDASFAERVRVFEETWKDPRMLVYVPE